MAIVKPLSVGEHTIRVRGAHSWNGSADSWVSLIDWHITVTPKEHRKDGRKHHDDDDCGDDDKGK